MWTTFQMFLIATAYPALKDNEQAQLRYQLKIVFNQYRNWFKYSSALSQLVRPHLLVWKGQIGLYQEKYHTWKEFKGDHVMWKSLRLKITVFLCWYSEKYVAQLQKFAGLP